MRKTPLSLLEDKWRAESVDVPPCALCGKLIEGEDEIGAILPVRLWRRDCSEEISFHPLCFSQVNCNR